MYFSGSATTRRKVDLSGKSKQQDRQKLLEQARQDRERRLRVKVENQSAVKIQKFYRGRICAGQQRGEVRAVWQAAYGEFGERATREDVLEASSKYFTELLFFIRPARAEDLSILASASRLLLAALGTAGLPLLSWADSGSRAVVFLRMRLFALVCLEALFFHRSFLKAELLQPWPPSRPGEGLATPLLEALLALTAGSPWSPSVISFLATRDMFPRLRILLLLQAGEVGGPPAQQGTNGTTAVEQLGLMLSLRHLADPDQRPKSSEAELPLAQRFSVQLGSIPSLWAQFPSFAKVLGGRVLWPALVDSLGGCVKELPAALPPDVSSTLPSQLCLLGNLLAEAPAGLAHPQASTQTAKQFANVAQHLLTAVPADASLHARGLPDSEESGGAEPMSMDAPPLAPVLERDLAHVADAAMLLHLVRLSLPMVDPAQPCHSPGRAGPQGVEACQSLEEEGAAVGSACGLLHTAMALLPRQRTRMLTSMAWHAQLVPRLWAHLRRCQLAGLWPPGPTSASAFPGGWQPWLLPLAVLCPVISYMLLTTDNDEFYEKEKPLPLASLAFLVEVLREAVWQLHLVPAAPQDASPLAPLRLKQHVSTVAARLLAQLHDRNCQREFTEPERFQAQGSLDETFYAQAEQEKSRTHQMLEEAPFLVPFSGRVRIYNSLLLAERMESGGGLPYRGVRITIRRDRILEDSFAQLQGLPPEQWRGTIRVQYVNAFGAEEAGVDGGGMLKDFLENITRAVFDVNHGLFKETSAHLLYPNPSSAATVHDHLRYFEFVGKVLGKAMYEGILVDIRFATFFLSKLRNKHNYLHDLPSLDPELYRSLLFLKNYEGDVAELALSFVVEDSVLGRIVQTELLPGGRDIPVTRDNAIRYVWLVANHHLNTQIQQQSRAFLSGFQELVPARLIAMFSEQELQMLISGSEEGMDMEDLRAHTNYSGGYTAEHPVIQALWTVLLGLSTTLQHQFLKFVTGCSRGPLMGFQHLEPRFCVHRAALNDLDTEAMERLPTAATCLNLLKLPPYPSKEVIQDKLVYAVTAGAGFDLS